MEAGTQSVLILLWAMFWMLVLSLMMVHPMLRTMRVQIRSSLRLYTHNWRATQHRMKAHFRVRLGKTLLWLIRGLEHRSSSPLWMRFAIKQVFNLVFMYLMWRLISREPLHWTYVLGFFAMNWTTDGIITWWKRRKQRLRGTPSQDLTGAKPAEQRAKT